MDTNTAAVALGRMEPAAACTLLYFMKTKAAAFIRMGPEAAASLKRTDPDIVSEVLSQMDPGTVAAVLARLTSDAEALALKAWTLSPPR